MFELIVFIIFLISALGVLFILFRKAPVLVTLPRNGKTGIRDHHLVSNIEKKIKRMAIALEKQIFLHKLLSWVKVMTLKIETKVDHLLHSIRRKAQLVDKKHKR